MRRRRARARPPGSRASTPANLRSTPVRVAQRPHQHPHRSRRTCSHAQTRHQLAATRPTPMPGAPFFSAGSRLPQARVRTPTWQGLSARAAH
jgi:hypothetical protein